MSADALDTNVFVYLFDRVEVRKREIAERIVAEAIEGHQVSISYQVVQETLSVIAGRSSRLPPRVMPRSSLSRF